MTTLATNDNNATKDTRTKTAAVDALLIPKLTNASKENNH